MHTSLVHSAISLPPDQQIDNHNHELEMLGIGYILGYNSWFLNTVCVKDFISDHLINYSDHLT